MRWSLSFLLIGFASIANALLPGWHLIDNLNELTTTTKFLLSPARDINLVNAPQIIIRRGPLYHVLDGMRGFFREGTALANQFRGEEGYHDEEAEAVLYALESLINVNKMLVDIFHDKAPLLSKIPAIGKPIAAGIQSVDTIIKVLTSDISSALPLELAQRAEKAEVELSISLEEAIKTYGSFEKMDFVTDANGSGSWLA